MCTSWLRAALSRVSCDGIYYLRPRHRGQGVPPALDNQQFGARDSSGGIPATCDGYERVRVAGDDQRGCGDGLERLPATIGGDDGRQLTGRARGIQAAIDYLSSIVRHNRRLLFPGLDHAAFQCFC